MAALPIVAVDDWTMGQLVVPARRQIHQSPTPPGDNAGGRR